MGADLPAEALCEQAEQHGSDEYDEHGCQVTKPARPAGWVQEEVAVNQIDFEDAATEEGHPVRRKADGYAEQESDAGDGDDDDEQDVELFDAHCVGGEHCQYGDSAQGDCSRFLGLPIQTPGDGAKTEAEYGWPEHVGRRCVEMTPCADRGARQQEGNGRTSGDQEFRQ